MGRKRAPLRTAAVLVTLLLGSQGLASAETARVLVVGDSWAELTWITRALRVTFAAHGHPDIVEKGDLTAISGSEASEWATPAFLQLISDELTANPTIDIVQLTIGGNDFLAGQSGDGWYAGMPDEMALFDRITSDVATVVDHILGVDPEVQVLISAYDYPNFQESLTRLLFFVCLPAWNDLGRPSPIVLNTSILSLGQQIEALAVTRRRVVAVSHWGLMQYAFGFPSFEPPISPGTLLPPGDRSLQSPIEAMALQADCIHLSAAGYLAVAENLWWSFYRDVFELAIFTDGFESGDLEAWSSSP